MLNHIKMRQIRNILKLLWSINVKKERKKKLYPKEKKLYPRIIIKKNLVPTNNISSVSSDATRIQICYSNIKKCCKAHGFSVHTNN